MKPTVSINLCVLNGENYIREALDSIVNQTYQDWELIIINDGSSDTTESIIAEYIDRGFPIIYHYQENKGLGYSRNEALKRSHGDYIAFIDHDDLWLPEKLEKQVRLFNDSRVGLVYSNFYYLEEKAKRKKIAYKNKICPSGDVFKKFLIDYRLSIPTVMIRNLPGYRFDPVLQVSEEYDLFMQILYRYNAQYLSDALAVYRIHSNMISKRHLDLYPVEMEHVLSRFDREMEGFPSTYKRERDYLLFKIGYWKARAYMAAGDRRRAMRALMEPKGLWTYKIPLLFLIASGRNIWTFFHMLTNHYY